MFCNWPLLVNYKIHLCYGVVVSFHLLLGVPPIVPELKGDADTSYFDDIEQDDHNPTETFPTPTVSLCASVRTYMCQFVHACLSVRVSVYVHVYVCDLHSETHSMRVCVSTIYMSMSVWPNKVNTCGRPAMLAGLGQERSLPFNPHYWLGLVRNQLV